LETFSTREEALQAEVDLHKFYQEYKNPHFANKARQKTTGFYYSFKGAIRTEEYKKKMSERLKGREIKPEWIEKNERKSKTCFW
jgi:predicted GIY-YIG superfamily endonuclease